MARKINPGSIKTGSGSSSGSSKDPVVLIGSGMSGAISVGQLGNIPPDGTLATAVAGSGTLSDPALEGLEEHLDDPNAHHIRPLVEAIVDNLTGLGDGTIPLPAHTIGQTFDVLVGAVAAEPPHVGEWKSSTGFTGIPDWGKLKLNDADLKARGLLTTPNDPSNVYPYYYVPPAPTLDPEFPVRGNDPPTDPLWNSLVSSVVLPGAGAGSSYAGGFTRDGTLINQPVMRTNRILAQQSTRLPVVISGSVYPADRGVLALVHWTPDGTWASFLGQPLLDRCIAAILLGQGIMAPVVPPTLPVCFRDDTLPPGVEPPPEDGDAGGIFAVGTAPDSTYNPFVYPGRATGQYDLRELVRGQSDTDNTTLIPPWDTGLRRFNPSVVPGPGQVRLGTDPLAGVPVQPYGIPVLGGGALLYDPIPADFVDGFRVLQGTLGEANTIIWEESPTDQDKNFFAYRLPVLENYTAATGLKYTPRGVDANQTKETERYFRPKEPNSGPTGLTVDGFLPSAGNFLPFDEDFWGWQVARYRHGFLLPAGSEAGVDLTTTDFRIQHLSTSILNGVTTRTLTSPGDFTTFNPDQTIILISGVTQQASGPAMGVIVDPDDVTVFTSPNLLGTTLDVERHGVDGATIVNLTLIEYIGAPGDVNEFLVRSRNIRNPSMPSQYSPTVAFTNPAKGVVFSGGSGANSNWFDHLARAHVKLTGIGAGDIIATYPTGVDVATDFVWQAVEFTGSAWSVQTGLVVPGTSPTPAIVSVTSVDPNHSWVYGLLRSDQGGSDDQGFRAWLSDSTTLNVECEASSVDKEVQWTILTNPYLTVQSGTRDAQWLALTLANLIDPVDFTAVPDITKAWAWAAGFTPTGGGLDTDYLPSLWQFELLPGPALGNTLCFTRQTSGRVLSFAFQVMSFAGTTATVAPGTKKEAGTYQLIHFKKEADFEAFVRDGIAPNDPTNGYPLYGTYLLNPPTSNVEEDENLINKVTDPNAFAPFGPAPAYGYGSKPYHTLRSTLVLEAAPYLTPSDTPSGLNTATWSWTSEALPLAPVEHVMWVSGVRYLLPRKRDDGSISLQVSMDIDGSDFWYTYRTEDNALTGDPQTDPANLSSPCPLFVGLAPFSYEIDSVTTLPTYDPNGLTNSFGTRLQRMEIPYRFMGSNGGGTYSEANGPREVDLISVATGANIISFFGDMHNPSFSADARFRVFTRRPLAHLDADGSALPFTEADGHGVPLLDTPNPKILYHSIRFSTAGDQGLFGNFQDPGNLPRGYAGLFTFEKDGWERFLDETYRYLGAFAGAVGGIPAITSEQTNQLDGPGMRGWVGGLIAIPVRAGLTTHVGWSAISWLQFFYQSDLSLIPFELQVAGLPDRNPPLSDGAQFPFPSTGMVLYPQIDYSSGYRPSLLDLPSAQPDYSNEPVVGGIRQFIRVFDAAWAHSGNPANVSGQPFLTLRIDGLTLADFAYVPAGPGSLGLTGIALMLKVPGLTTWMDLGRRDGAGPSKQDALLDGAGCQIVGADTFDSVDPETGVVFCQIKVNVGPFANLTKYTTFPVSPQEGEVPVMVKVLMGPDAVDYTFDRKATAPGTFEPFAGAGVSASQVRGLVGIRVVRTDGQVTLP